MGGMNMGDARVLLFLNQFFAGIGAEDKADAPFDSRKGPLGPGKRLQSLLGDTTQIVVTVFCGDNYFASHHDEVIQHVSNIVKDEQITIAVAGPAFLAGRYGFACTEICHALSQSFDLYCVTAMHTENAGVIGYREYKDNKVFLLPTSDKVQGMEDALSRLAQFVLKLLSSHPMGAASEEGYLPRGIRITDVTNKTGAERTVDMLIAKLSDRPFVTEIPVITDEVTPIAPPIRNMEKACLALVTTSGIVAHGNPDKFKAMSNTKWAKYSIQGLKDMKEGKWDIIHGGYDTVYMNRDPNYGVPLDMVRQFEVSKELEQQRKFAKLYPYFYSSTGVGGVTSVMQRVGKEMAQEIKAQGIDGVLLVST
jgi:glycine/betaine/sarcosine/D-proline reductase family selenoprotein B